MANIQINLIAVLVCGIVTFLIGGLWYSAAVFGKKWMALVGLSEEQIKQGANPITYGVGFLSGLITTYVLANVVDFTGATTLEAGAMVGFMCWGGFVAPTSYNNQVNFLGKPTGLWAIDAGYNLVGFVISGGILAIWK